MTCKTTLTQPAVDMRAGDADEWRKVSSHLRALLLRCDVRGLSQYMSPEALQLLSSAVHHNTDPDLLLCIMDGALGGAAGMDCTPYLPVVGVLAEKYGHNASVEFGGPVTEVLRTAQMTTKDRMSDLESRCKALHRSVTNVHCHMWQASRMSKQFAP